MVKKLKIHGEEQDETSTQHFDFSIGRKCMYKFSKKATERYFSYAIESFLFLSFALSEEGLKFIEEKPDNSKDEKKLGKLEKFLGPLIN